ncbi:MAG: ABC transporter ATP-binding protein [Acidobacteriota bacterium]
MDKEQALIQLDDISKSYPEGGKLHRVLEGVDLQIAPGELVALLGPSGCGKSTLLNLIAGLDAPSGGRVRVAGHDLEALDEDARTKLRRGDVGFVFQFFNLVPTLTVLENLLLPLELAGRDDAEGRDRALELLDRVGLADRHGSFPDVLSGGQQQRVAIARALVHEPSLVLADEPTGNLDEASAEVVLELLESTVRDAGVTLVMATHSRDAAAIADRILRLHAGRIEEQLRAPRDAA